MTEVRKKLIEVSIPLEAINVASAREKSIRHGHPSTLHLWWARRPLAACRAVLFAQLVDDPSSWPDRFPTEEERDVERKRLHSIIRQMVEWPDAKPSHQARFEAALDAARWEIARSVAWNLREEPPPKGDAAVVLDYLQTKAPPVYDPFCGGGSIPLEAQRLGLRVYGSDLNPVAVLICKALIEIPPKFAGKPPVNPKAQVELKRGGIWNARGALGLADDVRYYGDWILNEAQKRIGHLYPKANLPDGTEADVIAWIWARTVRSPDPMAKGAMVPLVSSFMLETREGKKTWIAPIVSPRFEAGYQFTVKTGLLPKEQEDKLKKGTKVGRGSHFSCLLTGSVIDGDYIKEEGKAGRFGVRLMAVIAEATRGRTYLSPDRFQEQAALIASPPWEPAGDLPNDPRSFWTVQYGLSTFASLFTKRQLTTLATLSDLIKEVREKAFWDATAAGFEKSTARLAQGGSGAEAYADAIATYLGFANSRMADRHSSLTLWDPNPSGYAPKIAHTFSRQGLPMVWDYTEGNPFSSSSGNYHDAVNWIAKNIATLPARGSGQIYQTNACGPSLAITQAVISTDPPYYDNIPYADLSDFFYVWLRYSVGTVWPELFRRLVTPKEDELVAIPYRHGGKAEAEAFFMRGMKAALVAIRQVSRNDEPLAIYYAFKQSTSDMDGVTSAGWSSFLQAVVDAGLAVDGTWPIRTELANRLIAKKSNALASSIVLVCRDRASDAPIATRAEFIQTLKREMPDAIDVIRRAGVGPVDMQQSIIGPGMGVFTRYEKVLENDDTRMSVKTALSLINRVWEEIENELDANFDPETQVALAWFATYGFDTRGSGELIGLANAKNIPIDALFSSGVFTNLHGKAALTSRSSLPADWSPATDASVTVWECVQHTARVLSASDGGGEAAAQLVAQMGPKSADARALAYRLYEICSQKGWAGEALVYNELAQEWARLEDIAANLTSPARATTGAQGAFTFDKGAA